MPNTTSEADTASLRVERPAPDHARVCLLGDWDLKHSPETQLDAVRRELTQAQHLSFDCQSLTLWDSGLLIFLHTLLAEAKAQGVEVDPSGLPPGVQRLLKLASATPDRVGAERHIVALGIVPHLGLMLHRTWRDIVDTLTFVGDCVLALLHVLTRRTKFNFRDLWPLLQECGPRALPIVTLVSFLVGTIIAYMGAVQMRQFGAEIYIANLVGLGMAREMGAIMTGIVVAGRSGAAFAAQLGTMQVNEEVDALKSLGISPIDYLVLPRMVALILMVPLLTVYANTMGMLGGMVVSIGLMDLHPLQYFHQTVSAVSISDFIAGFVKAGVYGVLIALAGCMRGMQCGRDAQAVGDAATSAVVTSIVFMVVAAAILAVVFHEIGL